MEKRNHKSKEDFSILRPSIQVGITGVEQVLNCMHIGTVEIQDLLLNECDIVFECKVCRNLFRSLPNFLAHKRVYCRDVYRYIRQTQFPPSHTSEVETVVVHPEAPPESLQDDCEAVQNDLQPPTLEVKDSFTHAMEKIQEGMFDGKSSAYKLYTNVVQNINTRKSRKEKTTVVKLTSIEGNKNAMYQSVRNHGETSDEDDEESRDSVSVTSNKSSSTRSKANQSNDEVCVVNPKAAQGYVRMNLRQRGKDAESGERINNKSTNLKKRARDEKSNDNTAHRVEEKLENPDEETVKRRSIRTSNKVKEENGNYNKNSRSQESSGDDGSEISESESVPSPPALRSLQKREEVPLKKQLEQHPECDIKNLKCTKCKTEYASLKTLHFHMMSLHSEKRVFYPCIYCSSMFAQLWGVTRHIQRTHRKTKAQVQSLRDTLKKRRVFKSVDEVGEYETPRKSKEVVSRRPGSAPPKKYIRVEKATRIEKATVEPWIDRPAPEARPEKTIKKLQIEKAAKKRNEKEKHALKVEKTTREPGEVVIQHTEVANVISQVAKKEVVPPLTVAIARTSKIDAVLELISCPQCEKAFAKRENLNRHLELCNAPKARAKAASEQNPNTDSDRPRRFIRVTNKKDEDKSSRPRVRTISDGSKSSEGSSQVEGDVISAKELKNKRVEKQDFMNSLVGFSEQDLNQIDSMVEMEKLVCLRCNRQYGSISNLRRHAVRHLGWKRFKCHLCRFTSYNRSECRSHLRRIHSNRIHRESDLYKYIIDLESDTGICEEESSTSSASTKVDRRKPGISLLNIHDPEKDQSFNISTRNSPRKFDTKPVPKVDRMQVLSTRSGNYVKKVQLSPEKEETTEETTETITTTKAEVPSPIKSFPDRGNVFENVGHILKQDMTGNANKSKDSSETKASTDLQETNSSKEYELRSEGSNMSSNEKLDEELSDLVENPSSNSGELLHLNNPSTDIEQNTGNQKLEVNVSSVALDSVVLQLEDPLSTQSSAVSFTHTARIVYPDLPEDIMDTESEVAENLNKTQDSRGADVLEFALKEAEIFETAERQDADMSIEQANSVITNANKVEDLEMENPINESTLKEIFITPESIEDGGDISSEHTDGTSCKVNEVELEMESQEHDAIAADNDGPVGIIATEPEPSSDIIETDLLSMIEQDMKEFSA